MLVSEFITKLRRFSGDFKTLTRDVFDGDGTTVAFRTTHRPIIEGSNNVTVKIGSSVKAEGTDFTLDRDTGLLEFTTAPASGSDNVTIDYYYFNMHDTEWIEIINNIIRETKDYIWDEKIDETTLTSVKNQDDYDLSSISTRILGIIDMWAKKSSETEWKSFQTYGVNPRFYLLKNTLNVRPSFSYTGYLFRFRYLEYYAEVSNTTDTFTIPTKYHNAFEYLCIAEYFDRLAAKKVHETGAKTKDITYTPAETMVNIATRYRKIGQEKLSLVKPVKPAIKIPVIQSGIMS